MSSHIKLDHCELYYMYIQNGLIFMHFIRCMQVPVDLIQK